jgi:hypothetical protein
MRDGDGDVEKRIDARCTCLRGKYDGVVQLRSRDYTTEDGCRLKVENRKSRIEDRGSRVEGRARGQESGVVLSATRLA